MRFPLNAASGLSWNYSFHGVWDWTIWREECVDTVFRSQLMHQFWIHHSGSSPLNSGEVLLPKPDRCVSQQLVLNSSTVWTHRCTVEDGFAITWLSPTCDQVWYMYSSLGSEVVKWMLWPGPSTHTLRRYTANRRYSLWWLLFLLVNESAQDLLFD